MSASGEIAPHGLPAMKADEKKGGSASKTAGTVCVILGIGAGIGLGVIKTGLLDAVSQSKLDNIVSNDLHFLYLSAALFGRAVAFLNFYPMVYKGLIMRQKSGNLRANMQIFKQLNESKVSSYIGLEDEGDIGKYNRANRSLTHFVENSIPTTLAMGLAGYMFPKTTLALTGLFAAGRVWHQVGYSGGGYGKHGMGFLLSMIGGTTLEGLCLLVALKGFGVPCL